VSGSTAKGSVVFVGAGPGDPELMTVRAVRRLYESDVVLYDALVDPRIVAMIPEHVQKISVGKRAGRHSFTQTEINALLLHLALKGKKVLRLKGGDPTIFGRLGEELETLRGYGVETEIVPGVTTAMAAAARAGISLTHRGLASAVQFITASNKDAELPDLPWAKVATGHATTAIYMGRKLGIPMAKRLIAEGAPADLAVLVVSAVTTPNERIQLTTLSDMADVLMGCEDKSPVLLILGEVAALADSKAVEIADVRPEPAKGQAGA
jgi:uroporphyrin-III C-methyltransferase